MLYVGAIKVDLEIDTGGEIEVIPVHYIAPSENKEADNMKTLKSSCKFENKKDEKRFYELAKEDASIMLVELNTLVREAKKGKQLEFWTSYFKKKSQ